MKQIFIEVIFIHCIKTEKRVAKKRLNTFRPAGQNISQIDYSIGGIIVRNISGFPLPEAHLVLHPLSGRFPLLFPVIRVFAVRTPTPEIIQI